jgi:hypothetical protein
MRDLLDAPVEEWEAERARTAETGWVRRAPQLARERRRLARKAVDRVDVDVHLLVACGLPERHPSTRHLLTDEAPHEVVDAIRDAVVAA